MYDSNTSYAMVALSFLSLIAAAVIIAIYFKYTHLQKKTYVQMIFFSAVADFLFAFSTFLGEMEDDNPLCIVQGLMTNIFPLASVFWTAFATYLLYCNVVISKPFVVTKRIHLFCWGFPIAVSLLAYSTNRIGQPFGMGWCSVANRPDSPQWGLLFWNLMGFYVWMLLSLTTMVVLIALIHIQTRKIKMASMRITQNSAQIAVISIYVYPLIVGICWIVPLYVDLSDISGKQYSDRVVLHGLASTLPILQGLLTSIIFCSTTPYIRRIVMSFTRCKGFPVPEVDSLLILSRRLSVTMRSRRFAISTRDSVRTAINIARSRAPSLMSQKIECTSPTLRSHMVSPKSFSRDRVVIPTSSSPSRERQFGPIPSPSSPKSPVRDRSFNPTTSPSIRDHLQFDHSSFLDSMRPTVSILVKPQNTEFIQRSVPEKVYCNNSKEEKSDN